MTKIFLGWIAIFIAAVWAFISYDAYVCGIKGLCGKDAESRESYMRIFDGEKEYEKKPVKKKEKTEEEKIIREVFKKSPESGIVNLLEPKGQRVLSGLWRKEVEKHKGTPLTFEQYLKMHRDAQPKKEIWEVKDFFGEMPTMVPPQEAPEIPLELTFDPFGTPPVGEETLSEENPEDREEEMLEKEPRDNKAVEEVVLEDAVDADKEDASAHPKSYESEKLSVDPVEVVVDGVNVQKMPLEEDPSEFLPVGECTEYITVYMEYRSENNKVEVKKLEQFLVIFEGENLPIDGVFSLEDKKAVMRFQEKYASEILAPLGLTEGTGNVYSQTIRKINDTYCHQ